jgi:hypothetical protein
LSFFFFFSFSSSSSFYFFFYFFFFFFFLECLSLSPLVSYASITLLTLQPPGGQEGKNSLCIRVLTMSKGCTTSVAIVPALSPAIDSTRAGERPPSWLPGMELLASELRPVTLSGGANATGECSLMWREERERERERERGEPWVFVLACGP